MFQEGTKFIENSQMRKPQQHWSGQKDDEHASETEHAKQAKGSWGRETFIRQHALQELAGLIPERFSSV